RASPPAAALPAATANGPLLTEQRRKEQFLREAVEQYAYPGTDTARRDLGVRHNLELGLFYLKENRLDEADEFFVKLTSAGSVVPYRTLGRLGHAIVLARQDR